MLQAAKITIAIAGLVALFLIFLLAYSRAGERSPQETFRDSRGNTIGTATRSGNQTIFRDNRGNTTGTATTDSTGNTTFRDNRGSTTGTLSVPSRRRW